MTAADVAADEAGLLLEAAARAAAADERVGGIAAGQRRTRAPVTSEGVRKSQSGLADGRTFQGRS